MKKIFITLILFAITKCHFGQGNIIGGFEIDINTIPWQVSLENTANNNNHFCGASIINERWVLTAAHCIVLGQSNPAQITVHAGSTNQTNNSIGQRIVCNQVFVHPEYNATTQENDIALLRLTTPLQVNANVQIARYSSPCNTTDAMIAPGQIGALTGWGLTCNTCPVSPTLRRVNMPIIDNAQAMAIQQANNVNNTAVVSGNMLAFFQNGAGAAPGDSGGPATIWDANGNPIVVGASSWGYFPKDINPTIYTRVRNYANWIQTTTGLIEGLENATIQGADFFCSTTSQYSVINAINGSTVLWTTSNGGVATVSATGLLNKASNGIVILTATVTNPCGLSRTLTKNIVVGTPVPTGINGPDHDLCYNGRNSEIAWFNVANPISGLTYQWQIDGLVAGTGNSVSVDAFRWDVGIHQIRIRSYSSACGYSAWYTSSFIVIDCSGNRFTVSPNPSSDNINVSVNNLSKNISKQIEVQELELIDKMGNIRYKRRLGKGLSSANISVSNLPDDIYSLRVFDGDIWHSYKVSIQH